MAPFNPGIAPTNDPNWLGQSKGYNRSDVPTDTTLGKLFAGVGEAIGPTVTAVDTAIQTGIKDELYEKIDPIRAAHGADVSPEETPAIAGKGGRGARHEAGAPAEDLAKEEALPSGARTRIDGLKRMSEAYNAGKLSNSHYYASLEAVVKEVRNRYPGYREQIDGMVSKITGVTPANALRSSVLSDMASMAASSNSAASKIEKQFLSDREWLLRVDPSLTLQKYSANKQKYDIDAGRLMARDQSIKSRELELGLSDKTDAGAERRSGQILTDRVNMEVSSFVGGVVNQLQKRSETLQAQGANANPKEIEQLRADWQVARGQLETRLRGIARAPINDKGNSLSTYMKPADIEGRIKEGLDTMEPVIANLGNKATNGVSNSIANILKFQHHRDVLKFEEKFPKARVIRAATDTVGPQGGAIILEQSGVLPELNKAITDTAWLTIADKGSGRPPPYASDALDAHGDSLTPKVAKVTIDGIKEFAKSKDPDVALRAIKSLYEDPRLFAETDTKDKLRLYLGLADQKVAARARELGGEAWETYSGFMERNFPTVFKQGMDTLQGIVTDNTAAWSFNDKSFQFTVKSTVHKEGSQAQRVQSERLQAQLTYLNRGLKAVEPVMREKYGDEAPYHLARLIQNQPGMDFAAAPKGSMIEEMGKSLSGWVRERVAPLFEDNVLGVKVDNIPEGMSAREFIRMLQTKEQKKQEAQGQSPGK